MGELMQILSGHLLWPCCLKEPISSGVLCSAVVTLSTHWSGGHMAQLHRCGYTQHTLIWWTHGSTPPVWLHSAHTDLVDTWLNSTMYHISGTLRPTALPWLPVLANIELWRKAAVDRLVIKVSVHEDWLIYTDLYHLAQQWLHHVTLCSDLQSIYITACWRQHWKSAQMVNFHLLENPATRQPGFDLPWYSWTNFTWVSVMLATRPALTCAQMMSGIVNSCLLLLVCVSWPIIGHLWNSVFICRV